MFIAKTLIKILIIPANSKINNNIINNKIFTHNRNPSNIIPCQEGIMDLNQINNLMYLHHINNIILSQNLYHICEMKEVVMGKIIWKKREKFRNHNNKIKNKVRIME